MNLGPILPIYLSLILNYVFNQKEEDHEKSENSY